MGGLPPGGPQLGATAPMQPPVGDVRTGAMDQYRNALLRRMQGAIPGQAPQMPGGNGVDAEGGLEQGGAMAPEMDEMPTEGPPDIQSIIQGLTKSRFSRRVLGRGNG